MKRTLALSVAAPCCALAILLAACTGGGTAEPADDGQSIDQPAPKPENPDDPDTPDNPANPDTPDDPDNPDNPGEEAPAYKTVKEVLQEILGDDYNDISGEISQNITLTAQTIDAVTDIFSDSKSAKDTFNNLSDKEYDINQVKRALVAQAEGKFSVTKKKLEEENEVLQGVFEKEDKKQEGGLSPIWGSNLYYISNKADTFKIYLSGEFDYFYNHIESLEGDIDISNLRIISHELDGERILVPTSLLKEEIYNKLKLENKDKNSLPTLSFGLHNNDDFGLKHFLAIYEKYNKSEKLNIDAYFGSMDGRKLVDVDNYTLFESDGNTAKNNKDTSIRSFEIDELIDFTKKYHISDISNLIIYGDAKTAEVDWQPTNIIFEGDMSKVENKSTGGLKGIVYFKDLPYDNEAVGGQKINGAVRLNELEGLKDFKINNNGEHKKSVVDLREINEEKMRKYNPSYEDHIFKWIGAVYFAEDIEDLAKNYKFYDKFIYSNKGDYIHNEYFGNGVRRNPIVYEEYDSSSFITSKTARKLNEFEYFGNNGYYKESAKDSYKDNLKEDNFEDLNLFDEQINLLKTNDDKTIAKVTTLYPLC